MKRVDDFILHGLSRRVRRLKGLAERSDAMVSIYEHGARFQKHVDNPNRDGRVLTSIATGLREEAKRPRERGERAPEVYLNYGEAWKEHDGGQLRMFLDGPSLSLMPRHHSYTLEIEVNKHK